MSNDTRERIIQAGATIMHRQGFQGTGLKEILEAAGAPKGSFYHYFPSKEAFGLAVIESFEARLRAIGEEVLTREDLAPLERLGAFVARFRAFYAAHDHGLGCPIGNLAQEMGDLSEPLRLRLRAAMAGLTAFFRLIVTSGQAAGAVDPDLPVEETAQFLVAGWQGALLRMKLERNDRPLVLFERFARMLLTRGGRLADG